MKKITLLLSAFLCIVISINAQEKSKQKRHVERQSEKIINHESSINDILWKSKWWVEKGNQVRNFKSEETKHSLDSIITYSGWIDEESFELSEKETYEYDENGLNTAHNSFSIYYSGDMELDSRTEFGYVSGKVDNIIEFGVYDYESNELMPESRTDYFYNDDESIKKVLMSEYDQNSDDWVSIMKVDYVYNDMQMVSTTVISILMDDFEYPFAIEQIYYTDDNQFDKIEAFIDYEMTGNLPLSAILDYEYENGMLYSQTSWSLDDNDILSLEARLIYEYDADNFINSELYSNYDSNAKLWYDLEKVNYINSKVRTFENTCLPLESTFEEDFYPYNYGVQEDAKGYYMDDEWGYNFHSIYYYNALGSGISEQNSNVNWTAYPNPTNREIKIDLQNTNQSNCRIFDATGRVIINRQVTNGQTIDLSVIKTGCYFMQLTDDLNQNKVIRLIKQ